MKQNGRKKMTNLIAIGVVSLTIIAAAALLSAPGQPPGGIGCLFYSAQSKPSGYVVYATISNNSTSPVAVEGAYFDGSERAYSAEFIDTIGGIWSMRAGTLPTTILGAGDVCTLLLTSTDASPATAHTVRVVTNTSSFEFSVELKKPSLALDSYAVFEGPGIDYVIAYVENVGTATGNIGQVAIDGIDFEYIHDMLPPTQKHQWSVVIGGDPAPYIDSGQQAQIYVSMKDVCHTCTHIMRVACTDGSSVEFSFALR